MYTAGAAPPPSVVVSGCMTWNELMLSQTWKTEPHWMHRPRPCMFYVRMLIAYGLSKVKKGWRVFAARHRWTLLRLNSTRQACAPFSYPGETELDWVDLGVGSMLRWFRPICPQTVTYLIATRPGIKRTTSLSQVQRPAVTKERKDT